MARMYLDTAASETSKPSILSSPWIRGAPHNGFSRDIRRISPRNSLDTGGRPGFPVATSGSRNVGSPFDASR